MITDYFQQLLDGFLNPQKRLFVGYLLSACVIAIVWLVIKYKFSLQHALQHIFAKKVWASPSAVLDYQIFLVNRLLMLLLSPILLAQATVAGFLFYSLYEWLPTRPTVLVEWSDWAVGLLFTVSYFVVDDFARFYVHRLLHRVPALWAFHKVHHTAEVLTPLTVLRTHPVEAIIFSLRTVLVQSVVIAVFVFFLGDRIDLVTVVGASVVVVLFNTIGANLRHSQIPVCYPRWLEKFLLSPAQHQVHHSVDPKHHDKNFGVALAVWDRLFRSFVYAPRQGNGEQPLVFGIAGERHNNLWQAYYRPFVESAYCLSGLRLSGLLSNMRKGIIARCRIKWFSVAEKVKVEKVV